jgi:hypothetical protein
VSVPLWVWDELKCCQKPCGNPVVSIVVAECGSVVIPDKQVQALCLQHLTSIESAGPVYELATRLEEP